MHRMMPGDESVRVPSRSKKRRSLACSLELLHERQVAAVGVHGTHQVARKSSASIGNVRRFRRSDRLF
jgi:hypothetical protein